MRSSRNGGQFEQSADCTAFQAFDWLSAWCRHIGLLTRTQPAIVVGRRHGAALFILPLGVTPGAVRRLTWLGSDLCDYNGPLLASGMASLLTPDQFRDLWRDICRQLQSDPRTRHDLVELTKMPERVGAQANPFLALSAGLNPSNAYVADLFGTWTEYYETKRSSATRRRDRTKLKRLGEMGEVRFVTPQDRSEIERSVDTLMEQKSRSFARMGVANMFARPGWSEFFAAVATDERTRHLVHVSRLDVGSVWLRSISAWCSAIPTVTCWRATTMARRRASGRASLICATCCAIRSSTGSSISISPSATSATSANGLTTHCCFTTTWPPLRFAAGPPPP